MRTLIAVAGVVGLFAGIVFVGSRVLDDDKRIAAPTSASVNGSVSTVSSTAGNAPRVRTSASTPRVSARGEADVRMWKHRANAACVRSISATARNNAHGTRTISGLLQAARLELADERRTISEIASFERLHTGAQWRTG